MAILGTTFSRASTMTSPMGLDVFSTSLLVSGAIDTSKAGMASSSSGVPSERKNPLSGVLMAKRNSGTGTPKSMV